MFPDPVEYTLSDPAGSPLSYLFDYTTNKVPKCFIPISYELKGQPNMFRLERVTNEIVISQSFDLTQRGIYSPVELIATIPDTAHTGSTITTTLSFTINVNPCPITSFMSDPATLGTLTYILGQNGF